MPNVRDYPGGRGLWTTTAGDCQLRPACRDGSDGSPRERARGGGAGPRRPSRGGRADEAAGGGPGLAPHQSWALRARARGADRSAAHGGGRSARAQVLRDHRVGRPRLVGCHLVRRDSGRRVAATGHDLGAASPDPPAAGDPRHRGAVPAPGHLRGRRRRGREPGPRGVLRDALRARPARRRPGARHGGLQRRGEHRGVPRVRRRGTASYTGIGAVPRCARPGRGERVVAARGRHAAVLGVRRPAPHPGREPPAVRPRRTASRHTGPPRPRGGRDRGVRRAAPPRLGPTRQGRRARRRLPRPRARGGGDDGGRRARHRPLRAPAPRRLRPGRGPPVVRPGLDHRAPAVVDPHLHRRPAPRPRRRRRVPAGSATAPPDVPHRDSRGPLARSYGVSVCRTSATIAPRRTERPRLSQAWVRRGRRGGGSRRRARRRGRPWGR